MRSNGPQSRVYTCVCVCVCDLNIRNAWQSKLVCAYVMPGHAVHVDHDKPVTLSMWHGRLLTGIGAAFAAGALHGHLVAGTLVEKQRDQWFQKVTHSRELVQWEKDVEELMAAVQREKTWDPLQWLSVASKAEQEAPGSATTHGWERVEAAIRARRPHYQGSVNWLLPCTWMTPLNLAPGGPSVEKEERDQCSQWDRDAPSLRHVVDTGFEGVGRSYVVPKVPYVDWKWACILPALPFVLAYNAGVLVTTREVSDAHSVLLCATLHDPALRHARIVMRTVGGRLLSLDQVVAPRTWYAPMFPSTVGCPRARVPRPRRPSPLPPV